ncbi:MAG: type II toxin-antitoxin system VapC family toxin [Chloroflexota bacterium]
MPIKVLDSYALIAFFEDESGAETVEALILKAEGDSLELAISVVNLGEVWYSIARKTSPSIADDYLREIQGMAIEVVDADWELTRLAAEFKVKGRVSYADCFAAALAKSRKAELVTGDKEFKSLGGEIKISWL